MLAHFFSRPSRVLCSFAFLSAAQAVASPTLVATLVSRCPITTQQYTFAAETNGKQEAAMLAAALLTSAADYLLGAGIDLVKAYLDPSQGQYGDKVVAAMPGLFLEGKQNIALSCLAVGVFDPDVVGLAQPPMKSLESYTRVIAKAEPFVSPEPSKRLPLVFKRNDAPLIYFEAVRRFSPDGTAHYYEPVYFFASRMAKPHFLSSDPVWEISMSWRGLDGAAFADWTFKFSGTPPFEKHRESLAGNSSKWVAIPTVAPDASKTGITRPFTLQVEIAEHRTATLFAKAVQKAVADNEALLKTAIRDRYPWRRDEVAQAAAAVEKQAETEARGRLDGYLALLGEYQTKCAKPATPTEAASCGATYTKLQQQLIVLKSDVVRFKIVESAALPAPSAPGWGPA